MHTIRLVMIPVGLALLASSNLAPALAQTAVKQCDDASLKDGKQIFRYDTFGSEDFWGGQVKLHLAIAGEKNGGVGPGLSPNKALELGLKVDLASVPKAIGPLIEAGTLNFDDPAVTLALLKANALVGVTGFFSKDGKTLLSIGIQCALCHSTVDDSLKPGIGLRLAVGPTATSTLKPS